MLLLVPAILWLAVVEGLFLAAVWAAPTDESIPSKNKSSTG